MSDVSTTDSHSNLINVQIHPDASSKPINNLKAIQNPTTIVQKQPAKSTKTTTQSSESATTKSEFETEDLVPLSDSEAEV